MPFVSEMDIENKITLLFIVFAIFVGAISILLDPLGAFLLAILFFYISYRMVPRVCDLVEQPLEGGGRKILQTGFLPYWLIWLVSWVLVYNALIV